MKTIPLFSLIKIIHNNHLSGRFHFAVTPYKLILYLKISPKSMCVLTVHTFIILIVFSFSRRSRTCRVSMYQVDVNQELKLWDWEILKAIENISTGAKLKKKLEEKLKIKTESCTTIPPGIVSAPLVEVFKKRLDSYLSGMV